MRKIDTAVRKDINTTLITWISQILKSANLLILSPLVLENFDSKMVGLWYLLVILIGIQASVDFGFTTTFIRLISYEIANNSQSNLKNLLVISKIIFHRVSIAVVFLFILLGTQSIITHAVNSNHWAETILVWITVLFGTWIFVKSYEYYVWIFAYEKIIEIRKIELLVALIQVSFSIIAIIFIKSILAVILTIQMPLILLFFLLKWKSKKITNQLYNESVLNSNKFSIKEVSIISLKTGIGTLMGIVPSQISSIWIAQIGTNPVISGFLFFQSLINGIKNVSTVPFYNKIPLMAKLFSLKNKKELYKTALIYGSFSLCIFLVGAFLLTIFGKSLAAIYKQSIVFPEYKMVIMFIFAVFIERIGALLLQFYSLSNHIVWHIVNSITSAIFVIAILLLGKNHINTYTYAYIISGLFFYLPITIYLNKYNNNEFIS
jgi:hypothetical protein